MARRADVRLTRWPAFTRFLDDGRIRLSNNAAERTLRGVALGRQVWLFAAPTAVANGRPLCTPDRYRQAQRHNPHASRADVLARIADHPASWLDELLPWNCKSRPATLAA